MIDPEKDVGKEADEFFAGVPIKTEKLHRMEACPICNKDFSDHLGIIGTCAELQKLKGTIEAIIIKGEALHIPPIIIDDLRKLIKS
jgi:hypothetical protein